MTAAVGDRPTARRLLQLTAFVSTFDRFVMPPMLIAIARDLGVPLTSVVQAASVYFLAYGVMQPVWGVVSDRIGLRRTMRITLAVATVATVASATVTGPIALALVRGLAGACFAAAIPSGLIYLGDTVPAANRQHEITNFMVGTALGTGLGAAGAGAIAQLWTWRAAFVITGAAALLLVIGLHWLPEPPRERRDQRLSAALRLISRSGATWLVLVLAFVDGLVLVGALTLLPAAVEAAGAGAALAGAVTAVYGVAVLLGARVTGRLTRRIAAWQLLAVGAASAAAACTLAAISRAPGVAVVIAVLLGLAWASLHSTLQTWATEVLPVARAQVVSLFAGFLFLGSAAAAFLAAGPAQRDQFGQIFAVAAVIAVPLGIAAAVGRRFWTGPGGDATPGRADA